MKILIEIDEQTAREIEAVAPGRERKRSEFIRLAIRRALDQRVEEQIEAGYRRVPHEVAAAVDPRAWGEWAPKAARRRGARKRRAR